ncbi:MAG: hypothetical protein WD960_13475 [Gemmatimonadota bacterium]
MIRAKALDLLAAGDLPSRQADSTLRGSSERRVDVPGHGLGSSQRSVGKEPILRRPDAKLDLCALDAGDQVIDALDYADDRARIEGEVRASSLHAVVVRRRRPLDVFIRGVTHLADPMVAICVAASLALGVLPAPSGAGVAGARIPTAVPRVASRSRLRRGARGLHPRQRGACCAPWMPRRMVPFEPSADCLTAS